MADLYARRVLRRTVALISQAIGYDLAQNTSIEVLTDILERYLYHSGKSIHDLAEQCKLFGGTSIPDVQDVAEYFHQNHISIAEISDYLQQMESIPVACEPFLFPKPKASNFQFPRAGHIHEMPHVFSHSPAMHQAVDTKHEAIPAENVPSRDLFTIVGKHNLSDDDADVDSIASDDSINSRDIRNLTKPEDIPAVSGIAASSWSSPLVPSTESVEIDVDGIPKPVSVNAPSGKTHTFKKASIASLKMEEPGRATKTDEPIWIKQHAAKLEVEKSKVSSTTSVPPPEEKTAPCTAVEKSKAHRVKSKGKESLWDSPLFDRKHSLSLSGDGNRKGSGSNLIGKEQHGLTVGPVLSHAVKSKESISSRIEEVDRLLKDPIIKKENSEDDLKTKCDSAVTTASGRARSAYTPKGGQTNTSTSMDEAIDAVIHRVNKEAEEAELMKFSHLIQDSSSGEDDDRGDYHDDDETVSHQTEQMLQLELRGLQKHHDDGSPSRPPPTPSPTHSNDSLVLDDDFDITTKGRNSSEERHSPQDDSSQEDVYDFAPTPSLKRKHPEKLSLVDEPVKHHHKSKKLGRKSKSGKKSKHRSKERPSKHSGDKSPVKKLILKKSNVEDGIIKVQKEKDSYPVDRDRERLPVPKLSAAVVAPQVHIKEKKEKKKKKDRDKPRPTKVKKIASPIPKLTFKVASDDRQISIVKPTKSKRSSSRETSVKKTEEKKESKPKEVERKVITQTISVGSTGIVFDAQGNRVWICPGCNKPDDGSPMIGCDSCDAWYHWPCAGIAAEPPEDEEWFCAPCTSKKKKRKGR